MTKIRKKAPVQAVQPVKAAHDRYMESFADHAANPTPSNRRARDAAQAQFNVVNAMAGR